MSNLNLTPIMLVSGPLLLLGAFMMWPAQTYVGERATQSLIDEADTLMPLLIAATLGVILMFGGLHLLNSQMMEGSTGMNKQLLTVAGMLIMVSLVSFVLGLGSNVTVINNVDVPQDNSQDWVDNAYKDGVDYMDSQNAAIDAGAVIWQMSPVTWGLAMIIIGLVAFLSERQEGAMGLVLPALMPIGSLFLSAPIINDPDLFNTVFPLVMITHVILGGLMLAGMVEVPGGPSEA